MARSVAEGAPCCGTVVVNVELGVRRERPGGRRVRSAVLVLGFVDVGAAGMAAVLGFARDVAEGGLVSLIKRRVGEGLDCVVGRDRPVFVVVSSQKP